MKNLLGIGVEKKPLEEKVGHFTVEEMSGICSRYGVDLYKQNLKLLGLKEDSLAMGSITRYFDYFKVEQIGKNRVKLTLRYYCTEGNSSERTVGDIHTGNDHSKKFSVRGKLPSE
jgi:hypothetical protein